jgi:YfiH family protein
MSEQNQTDIRTVRPNWDISERVIAFTTLATTADGSSLSFDRNSGLANRELLNAKLSPTTLLWLNTEHTANVLTVGDELSSLADAMVIDQPGLAAAITTADCLPVVFANSQGTQVAVAHAGWKGLVRGVLDNTVALMAGTAPTKTDITDLRVWIGPSICHDYQIQEDVYSQLLAYNYNSTDAFSYDADNRCFANLQQIAINRLVRMGIAKDNILVYGESTNLRADLFSVRRDGFDTGRMATVAGIRV